MFYLYMIISFLGGKRHISGFLSLFNNTNTPQVPKRNNEKEIDHEIWSWIINPHDIRSNLGTFRTSGPAPFSGLYLVLLIKLGCFNPIFGNFAIFLDKMSWHGSLTNKKLNFWLTFCDHVFRGTPIGPACPNHTQHRFWTKKL